MIKLINERYITLWNDNDTEQKEKYLDEVFKMIVDTYSPIGGSGISKEDLMNPHYMWKLVRRGDKISACQIYKAGGRYKDARKAIAGASDGTESGKKDLYAIWAEDISQAGRNAFTEVSGAPEHIMKNKLGSKPIPFEIANEILKANGHIDAEPVDDEYHYIRDIHGKKHKKIMLGNLPDWMIKIYEENK